ncbi:ABC transporter permease [Terrisporobacter sp.]
MLGKLIKYEFKACGRIFFPIYLGILILATINGICSNYSIFQSMEDGFAENDALMNIQTILMIVLFALFVALFVLTIILIIQRFKKNLLEDEGYLMFTLPVSSKSLILSKYLVSLIFVILSTLVAILSFMLMAMFFQDIQFTKLIHMIASEMPIIFTSGGFWKLILILIFELIIMYSIFVLTIYLSLSVGQFPQFNKYRTVAGVIAFFIINIVISNIQSFINNKIPVNIATMVDGTIGFDLTGYSIALIVVDILIVVLLFLGTNWILNKKLNLE